jgi:hypothetical protein
LSDRRQIKIKGSALEIDKDKNKKKDPCTSQRKRLGTRDEVKSQKTKRYKQDGRQAPSTPEKKCRGSGYAHMGTESSQ